VVIDKTPRVRATTLQWTAENAQENFGQKNQNFKPVYEDGQPAPGQSAGGATEEAAGKNNKVEKGKKEEKKVQFN